MELANILTFSTICSISYLIFNFAYVSSIDAKNVINLINITVQPNHKSKIQSKNNTTEAETEKLNNPEMTERQLVKLNMKQGLLMNQVLGVYTFKDETNQLCKNHSQEFANGLRAFEPWALRSLQSFYDEATFIKLTVCLLVFDSSSKLQAGILEGNLVEFGAFQQCLQIFKISQYGIIRGKSCTIKIRPNIQLMQTILEFRNITKKRFSKVYQFVSEAAFAWSICVPDSCNSKDVYKHLSKTIYPLTEGLNVSLSLDENDCQTLLDNKPFTNSELLIIALLTAFIVVVVICSIIDVLVSTTEEISSFDIVNIFSVYRNSKRIFASGGSNSHLDCVHGIRVLSTCYVVIGHRYLMLMFFPVVNSLKIMDWVLYYRSTAITGGTLCVDTFFMISGMLVSIGFFQQVEKLGKPNWLLFYLYRYMRITPPLAIVVLIYATLIHRLGSGPLWHDMLDIVQKPCQEYWWATLLHVQNYVHPFPLCMTQVWYLTCDMQYYFLSPLILVPLWKCRIFGYINYVSIYILAIASNFYFAWINKYDGGVPVTNQLFSTKYFQRHYIAPHTRAATYIIGLGLGYSIHKSRGKKIQITYSLAVSAWMIAIASMLAALVGCHAFHEESHNFNRLEASVYLSCSRSAWTFGIVWMVWACINGYGGPINFVLSSYTFKVLSKISYSIYLLHMVMQYLMSGAAKIPGYFSDFTAIYSAFGDLFMMVIVGFAFTVCFEMPLVKILAAVLKRGNGNKIGVKNNLS